jgi:DNA-binding XRE family transcriptional regulator
MLVARGYASSTPHNRVVSSKIAARFSQRVRELRIKRGLSQVEMAYQFGIDRGHIRNRNREKECLPSLAGGLLERVRN